MKRFAVILFLTILVLGCHRHNESLCSEYYGELPAADAPGILTAVRLQSPDKYQNTQIFVGKPDGTFIEKGCYQIDGNLLTFTATDGSISFYRIEKDQIRRLNMEKNAVTGPFADNYILKCTKN